MGGRGESPAAILLRVREVQGLASAAEAAAGSFDRARACGPGFEAETVIGDDIDSDDEPCRAADRERRGFGERTALRMKAMQRRATEGVSNWMPPRRLVGWAAIAMVVAGTGMIAIGIQQRLGERKVADDGVDGEGFSETVVPGANYVRHPGPDVPRPSDGFATLSAGGDVNSGGVIQSAFHTSSPASPRGAWLAGTIEEDLEFAESVSHEPVGPRLR
jgi:hypothetical protein